jgi:hypothetical protein
VLPYIVLWLAMIFFALRLLVRPAPGVVVLLLERGWPRPASPPTASRLWPSSTASMDLVEDLTQMGSALGAGITSPANDLALAGLGIATLALVVLGMGLMFSIVDRNATHWLKDALLGVIGGGAGVAASFMVSSFKL